MFIWSKLAKLRKKDPILHVTTTFSLKQGETRTSSGPIRYPLIFLLDEKGGSFLLVSVLHYFLLLNFIYSFASIMNVSVFTQMQVLNHASIAWYLLQHLGLDLLLQGKPRCEDFVSTRRVFPFHRHAWNKSVTSEKALMRTVDMVELYYTVLWTLECSGCCHRLAYRR